jgi:hypothetical protein
MQTLAPDSFCPLTNPQPYQREQDERRRTRARVDRSGSVEIISKVERTAVRRSLHRLVRCFASQLIGAIENHRAKPLQLPESARAGTQCETDAPQRRTADRPNAKIGGKKEKRVSSTSSQPTRSEGDPNAAKYRRAARVGGPSAPRAISRAANRRPSSPT